MTLDPRLLEEAIRRNDAAGIRDLLRDASEADRRAAAKTLKSLLTEPKFELPQPVFAASREEYELLRIRAYWEASRDKRKKREREKWYAMARTVALRAARVGLAGGVAAAVKVVGEERWPRAHLDVIAQVLADRQPPWLADFADRLLTGENLDGLHPTNDWPLARRLVRLGAIGRPQVPEYATRFPAAVAYGKWTQARGHQWVVTPYDALAADPGLLDDEVWRLFTVPDAAWRLDQDRTAGEGWADALARLAQEGSLDRGRLIDETLAAFTRDFPPHRVGWYVTLHDRLDPSAAEMAARAGAYLGLLAVTSKFGVRLGQRAAGMLLDAGVLDAERLLEASAPALLFPQKSIALTQLKLITKAIAQQPAARAHAMATAAQAFSHEREDIQEAALKLIARHGVPDGPERAVISELAQGLSPTPARDAAALGLLPQPCPHPILATAPLAQIPRPAPFQPSAGHTLPEPLTDSGELIQLLAQLMEDATDPVAVERALAGAVRLATLPAGERARLTAPLLKRAHKRAEQDYYGPFSGQEISSDIACLALAWGSGWTPTADRRHRGWRPERHAAVGRTGEAKIMAGILTARVWEATTLINSRRPARLLAEPESDRGAITPQALLDRLACWSTGPAGAQPPRHDLEIALLRLAPGADDEFWSAWADLHPATARAARRTYTAGHAPLHFTPVIGEPPVGPPGSGDPLTFVHVLAGLDHPDAETVWDARSHCWTLLTSLRGPLRGFRSQYGGELRQVNTHYDPVAAAWPLLCPWQPELAAAHLLRPISDGLKHGSSAAATAIGALANPGHALGPIGHLALITGLASAEPDTRITAADVWSQASLDGRLDPTLAAGAIVTGVTGGAFGLHRVTDALQHAAHEPIAGYRIIETVYAAASTLIAAKTPNLNRLLQLASRTATSTGTPPLPSAITALANLKTSSQLAAAARRLAASHTSAM
jgi:Family of unknown function (DUF6493)